MPVYPRPVGKDPWGQPDLVDYLARHIKAVKRDARRPNRLGEGLAAGRTDNELSTIAVGRLPDLGDGVKGARVRRRDGSTAFRVYAAPDGSGFVSLHDRHDQYIVSDDSQSGYGLARPYLPIPLMAYMPPLSGGNGNPQTASSSWTTLLIGSAPIHHPALMGTLAAECAAGVTAQLRIALDGQQIGDAVTIGPGWTFPLVGAAATVQTFYGQFRTVTVDAQVTSGGGAVALAAPATLYGVESAFLPPEVA